MSAMIITDDSIALVAIGRIQAAWKGFFELIGHLDEQANNERQLLKGITGQLPGLCPRRVKMSPILLGMAYDQ